MSPLHEGPCPPSVALEPSAGVARGSGQPVAADAVPERTAKRRKDDTSFAKPSAVRATRAAGLELIADPERWAKALEEFAAAELQPGSRSSLDSRLVTAEQFIRAASKLPLLPVTVEKLRTLGAVLRGVFYKAAPEYLRVVKAEHIANDLE